MIYTGEGAGSMWKQYDTIQPEKRIY